MMNRIPLVGAHDDGSRTIFPIGGHVVGKDFVVIAGPCSIETEHQLMKAAEAVKKAGAHILRGSAYKPRTSPYDFQGLGKAGLALLAKAGRDFELPVITEVMDTRMVDMIADYVDVLQIGARNMQNYPLLTAVGKTRRPVLLKRAWSATIDEWLNAAEYIVGAGNSHVILCERGIRTFEPSSRNTLDLNAVVTGKKQSSLPVFADPSHGTGHADMVRPMALAAVMAGCDGLEIEVHPDPSTALSDQAQQLTPNQFQSLMADINKTLVLRSDLSS